MNYFDKLDEQEKAMGTIEKHPTKTIDPPHVKAAKAYQNFLVSWMDALLMHKAGA